MRDAWQRYWKSRQGKIALGGLALWLCAAVLIPMVSIPASPEAAASLQGPGSAHWFGTDSLGRDLFVRLWMGARLSFEVGFFAGLVELVLGLFYGSCAAWLGGWGEAFLLRAADLLYALPSLLVSALFLLFFGHGPGALILAIGLTSWVGEARLVRALVSQALQLPYVESAESLGLTRGRIFWRHILPNILGPVLVNVALSIPANILLESFLSFVGLGLEAPFASLGTLANEGWRAFRSYPHLIFFPGLALFFMVFFFTLAGDAWRDGLDPA